MTSITAAACYLFISSSSLSSTKPTSNGGNNRSAIKTTATYSTVQSFPFNNLPYILSSLSSIQTNYGNRNHHHYGEDDTKKLSTSLMLATSTHLQNHNHNFHRRTYKTKADLYFQKYDQIPKPIIMHANLEHLLQNDKRILGFGTTTMSKTKTAPSATKATKATNFTSSSTTTTETKNQNNNILIIGDVHGCLTELQTLIHNAVIEHNDNHLFKCIVLVGDLCNKGPYSKEVIQFVRRQKNWYCVRGNHDDGALSVMIGDEGRRKKSYDWIPKNNNNINIDGEGKMDSNQDQHQFESCISDKDVEFLSNIPYTITIPKWFWKNNDQDINHNIDEDVIIVHAGLIPNVPLELQDIKTMVTIRDIVVSKDNDQHKHEPQLEDESDDKDSKTRLYSYYDRQDDHNNSISTSYTIQPWAKVWNGPQLVIFGHDAKRGIQIEDYAIGLDSGCTYGKKLSGIILPRKDIVSVDAEMIYCPIIKKKQ